MPDRHWNINIPGFGTTDDRIQKNKPTEGTLPTRTDDVDCVAVAAAYRQKVVSVRKDVTKDAVQAVAAATKQ